MKQGVMPHIKLNHEFVSAVWNGLARAYEILLRTDGVLRMEQHAILVSGTGGFSTPLWPKIDGLSEYEGRVIHASRWPKELKSEDLRGSSVVVVGNGCSGSVAAASGVGSS